MLTRIHSSAFRRSAIALAAGAGVLLTWTDLHGQSTTPLTLGGAARLAAERSAATAAAKERSAQASARVLQRRSEFLPSLTSTTQFGTRSYNTATMGIEIPGTPGSPAPYDPNGEVVGPVRNFDMRTQITQRLVDIPAMRRWRASATDADAALHKETAAAENAAQRGAIAYLNVLRAEARIEARSADSALASELLDIARQQLNAGVGISLDVTRAESQLADARARLIATRGERDRNLLQLRHELALSSDAPLAIADSLEIAAGSEAAIDEETMVRAALERRADFRAAIAESEGARGYARAASAERLPTLSVYGDHGTNGKETNNMLRTYSYGVQMSIPVFDGMRTSSRVSEQRARQREAEANAQDMRRQVETDVRSAIVSMASAREEVAAARARLVLAEQEVHQARERFKNGVSNNADVITASIGLNGARDLVIDALTSYQLAKVELAKAQGAMASLQ